ncbi:hypothetical protein [Arenicella xantha]|uniref:hypothetical protein n=1 Tax=Arenicella xantha TaxID=644221 RepID=UPI0011BE380E|nr:hypothetical protein [Arenicella xantha]
MPYYKNALLLVSLTVAACGPAQQSEVAMVALVANANEYDDRDVTTYGFLRKSKNVRLFLSREDAANNNDYHSIIFNNLSAAEIDEIGKCNNQYVYVSGTFKLKTNGLVFTNITHMKGQPEKPYSKLVCNHNFNRTQNHE